MAIMLPKFFVVPGNRYPDNRYLCPGENRLFCGESMILSPKAKFASEISKAGDVTLIHIRSCFNNKYWVARETEKAGEFLISASADKPEEDETNPACTLFRLSRETTSSGDSKFILQSIRWSLYVATDFQHYPLELGKIASGFHVIDWEQLVILPAQVTFKTEEGEYLRVTDDEADNKFESGLEFTDPRVAYELVPTPNGHYRIKSLHHGKFLKRGDQDWIGTGDKDYDEGDSNNTFECIIIRDNLVALRNLGNRKLCGSGSNWLTAKYQTATKEARLIIGEPVLRREISIAEYHLPKSRIFEGQVILLSQKYIDNSSPTKYLEESLTFSETVETTNGWCNSLSVKYEESAELEVEAVPLIVKGKVKLSRSIAWVGEWGGVKKGERKIETSTKVVVPPLTKMKVTLVCTKATCDVPFSYMQNDLLPDGKWVSTIKDDGLYTGVDVYDIRVTCVEVDEHGKELN